MMDLIQSLIAWVSAHPEWAGVAVFLIAFSESMAVVGLIVPGVVMMFAAGALVGAGAVGFLPIYLWATAGAILGDGLSFWLGRHYRNQIRCWWPFSKHPETLEKGIEFFRRWGGKSVALGRFFGPVRAVVPLVAGMMEMPVPRYLFASILSAFAWAAAYLLPGVAIGVSLELASEVALRLVVFALVILVGLWLLMWLLHRLFNWSQPFAARMIQRLLDFGHGESLPRKLAAALADPEHPEARGLAVMAAFLLLTAFIASTVATMVLGVGGFRGINHVTFNFLTALRIPPVDSLMVFITTLGDFWLLAGLSLIVFLVLVVHNSRTALYWLAAVCFAFIAPHLLKMGLQIPRPPGAPLDNWSFPSAHALQSTVIYGFLAVIISTPLKFDRRWPVYAGAFVLIALIGFSRLYLGVHWLSDVLGGIAIGGLWVAIVGLAWRHHPHRPVNGRNMAMLVIVWLVFASLWHLIQRHPERVAFYKPEIEMVEMSAQAWRSGRPLPLYREALIVSDQPLEFRYAGEVDALRGILLQNGWIEAPKFRPLDFLKFLLPGIREKDLPIVPQAYEGAMAVLTMIREADGEQQVLRFWPTHYRLGECTVWVGNQTSPEVRNVSGIVSVSRSISVPVDEKLRLLLETPRECS